MVTCSYRTKCAIFILLKRYLAWRRDMSLLYAQRWFRYHSFYLQNFFCFMCTYIIIKWARDKKTRGVLKDEKIRPLLILTFKHRKLACSVFSYYIGCIFSFTSGIFLPREFAKIRTNRQKKSFLAYLRSLKHKDRKRERKRLGIIYWKCLRHSRFVKANMLQYVKRVLLFSNLRKLDICIHGVPKRLYFYYRQIFKKRTFWGKWYKDTRFFKLSRVFFTNKYNYVVTQRRLKRKIRRRLKLNI